MNRRHFISSVLALATGALTFSAHAKTTRFLVAASDNPNGEHFLTWHSGKTAIPLRGHSVVAHPLKPNSVLVFARRPGTQCFEVDLQAQQITNTFMAQNGCNFSGHGVFSTDGTRLFCAEMHRHDGTGNITIRDSQTYKILQEYASGGLEPHQLLLLNNGNTLLIANGGILTRPETGRRKLNLNTMHSSLVFMDSGNGKIQMRLTTPWQQASIRHLSAAPDDSVAIAMQYQREAVAHRDLIPLTGFWHPGADAIAFNEAPEVLNAQLNDYVGSTVIHAETRVAAFSSPRGNLVAFWTLDGSYAGHYRLHDVCGLGVDGEYFVLSNSNGEVHYVRAASLEEDAGLRQHFANTRWDNHLTII
jgi:hypothetical protein